MLSATDLINAAAVEKMAIQVDVAAAKPSTAPEVVRCIHVHLHRALTWIGWLPFLACAARMRFTSPPIRPGSTVISLPSP